MPNDKEHKILNVIPTNDEYWQDDQNNPIIVNNYPTHEINLVTMNLDDLDNIVPNWKHYDDNLEIIDDNGHFVAFTSDN